MLKMITIINVTITTLEKNKGWGNQENEESLFIDSMVTKCLLNETSNIHKF